MGIFWRDLGYALRQLSRSRGFTLAAVATMALAIGANTAIFSVVNGVLLESLPFREANRLVSLKETHPQLRESAEATYPDFLDWRSQQNSFEELAAYSELNPATVSLRLPERSEQVHRVLVSGNFFSVLGVQAIVGRTLGVQDDRPGQDHVVVLSSAAWQLYFGRDPNVAGRGIDLNGSSFTIVGVLPSNASFPADGEVWLPLSQLDQGTQASRVWHSVRVLGRLREGISLEGARADMQTVAARLEATYPATNRGTGVELLPLREELVGSFRPTLLFVMGSALLILTIACANVASLLLVRASATQHQVALRQALGATRMRLLSQYTALALEICVLGGVFGTLLASLLLPSLRFALAHLPGLDASLIQSVRISIPVLAFSLGICVAATVLFGLLPILKSQPGLVQTLNATGRASTSGGRLVRGLLISCEVAVAVVVLFQGTLLTQSFGKLSSVDSGYRVDHLLSAEITLSGPGIQQSTPDTDRFYRQLVDRLSQVPGVRSVATVTQIPLSPSLSMTRFLVEGAPPVDAGAYPLAQIRTVSPGFFATIGLRLEEGRTFTQKESDDSSDLFIVNRTFANRYLNGRDPVGSKVVIGVLSAQPDHVPVIGVVSDAHDVGIDVAPPPEIFIPGYDLHEVLLVRTVADPRALIPAVRNIVHVLDPGQPVYHLQTIEELLSKSTARQKMTATLIGIFGSVALLLAAVGIHGVLSFSVLQRKREIGIRLALGSQRDSILNLIFLDIAGFLLAGATVGLVLAILCAQAIRGLLFNVTPVDSGSLLGTLATLIVVAALGVSIPALRATMTDPADALREE